MTIQINASDIRIRPSAVDNFFGCSYQWGKVFLEGQTSIPNSRAAIGTAIHKAAEVLWNEAIVTRSKEANLTMVTDAAIAEFQEIATEQDLSYNDGEDTNTCEQEIVKGTSAFVEDIVPFTEIPVATEEFYKVDISHPLVKELGGTIDYITKDTIADLKTSKRKASPSGYVTQQSIYRYLANENGKDIKHNLIQNVVLKKIPDGEILTLEPDVGRAKFLINSMLDTLELLAKDVAPAEVILRGNPKYMFCSPKFCALYNECPFVKGTIESAPQMKGPKL